MIDDHFHTNRHLQSNVNLRVKTGLLLLINGGVRTIIGCKYVLEQSLQRLRLDSTSSTILPLSYTLSQFILVNYMHTAFIEMFCAFSNAFLTHFKGSVSLTLNYAAFQRIASSLIKPLKILLPVRPHRTAF